MMVVFSGCGKKLVPFTYRIKEAFPDNYQDLQVYLGPPKEDLVLRRLIKNDSLKITDGRVVEKNGQFYNQVTITGGKPGKIVDPMSEVGQYNDDYVPENMLYVSFREGIVDVHLDFLLTKDSTFALSTEQRKLPNTTTTFWTDYGEYKFRVVSGNSVIFSPYYDKRQLKSIQRESVREKGWKISKTPKKEKKKGKAAKEDKEEE